MRSDYCQIPSYCEKSQKSPSYYQKNVADLNWSKSGRRSGRTPSRSNGIWALADWFAVYCLILQTKYTFCAPWLLSLRSHWTSILCTRKLFAVSRDKTTNVLCTKNGIVYATAMQIPSADLLMEWWINDGPIFYRFWSKQECNRHITTSYLVFAISCCMQFHSNDFTARAPSSSSVFAIHSPHVACAFDSDISIFNKNCTERGKIAQFCCLHFHACLHRLFWANTHCLLVIIPVGLW